MIEDEPPPRDRLALERFAAARLGKDVFDLSDVDAIRRRPDAARESPGARARATGSAWSGSTVPARRPCSGCSPASWRPDAAGCKRGRTVEIGAPDPGRGRARRGRRVLESVEQIAPARPSRHGGEASAPAARALRLHRDQLTTRIDDLSGGERRRLQCCGCCCRAQRAAPRRAHERPRHRHADRARGLPGLAGRDARRGLHDRYFLERVCDITYALLGDGSCVLCPAGSSSISRRGGRAGPPRRPGDRAGQGDVIAAEQRQAGRGSRPDRAAADQARRPGSTVPRSDGSGGERLRPARRRQAELNEATREHSALEDAWLERAEICLAMRR